MAARYWELFPEKDRIYLYAPLGANPPIQRELPLISFLRLLGAQLGKGYLSNDPLGPFWLKGGAKHYGLTGRLRPLSDIDIDIDLKQEGIDWNRVEQVALAALAQVTQLPPINKNELQWRTVRHVENKGGKGFAIHGFPTWIGGQYQPIELTFTSRNPNQCFSSHDAVRISLLPAMQGRRDVPIPMKTVDGYDITTCFALTERHLFTANLAAVPQIKGRFQGYCKTLLLGDHPTTPEIEEAYLEKPVPAIGDYLQKHYRNDPESQILYLLNYYAALDRHKIGGTPVLEPLRKILDPQGTYRPEEIEDFCRYACTYLYLRAAERQKSEWEKHHAMVPVQRDRREITGDLYLFLRYPRETIEELRTSPERAVSHKLLQELSLRFSHSAPDLAAFFRTRIEGLFPRRVEPLASPPAAAIVEDDQMERLAELCDRRRWREAIALYQKKKDPLFPEILAKYIQKHNAPLEPLFEVLSVGQLHLLRLFEEKHAAAICAWLLKAPLPFARNYLSSHPFLRKDLLEPLVKQFGAALCIDEPSNYRTCIQKLSPKLLGDLYASLEPHFLSLDDPLFLEAFSLFFAALYPKPVLKKGIERLISMKEGNFQDILEHLHKHKVLPPLQQWMEERTKPAEGGTLVQLQTMLMESLKHPEKFEGVTYRVWTSLIGSVIDRTFSEETLWALRGTLQDLYHDKRIQQEHQKQVYLFTIHILTSYLSLYKDQPVENVLAALKSTLESGVHKKVLDLKTLERICPFSDKLFSLKGQFFLMSQKQKGNYWNELIHILILWPKELRSLTRTVAATLPNPQDRAQLFFSVGKQYLLIADLAYEALPYMELSSNELLQAQDQSPWVEFSKASAYLLEHVPDNLKTRAKALYERSLTALQSFPRVLSLLLEHVEQTGVIDQEIQIFERLKTTKWPRDAMRAIYLCNLRVLGLQVSWPAPSVPLWDEVADTLKTGLERDMISPSDFVFSNPANPIEKTKLWETMMKELPSNPKISQIIRQSLLPQIRQPEQRFSFLEIVAKDCGARDAWATINHASQYLTMAIETLELCKKKGPFALEACFQIWELASQVLILQDKAPFEQQRENKKIIYRLYRRILPHIPQNRIVPIQENEPLTPADQQRYRWCSRFLSDPTPVATTPDDFFKFVAQSAVAFSEEK